EQRNSAKRGGAVRAHRPHPSVTGGRVPPLAQRAVTAACLQHVAVGINSIEGFQELDISFGRKRKARDLKQQLVIARFLVDARYCGDSVGDPKLLAIEISRCPP